MIHAVRPLVRGTARSSLWSRCATLAMRRPARFVRLLHVEDAGAGPEMHEAPAIYQGMSVKLLKDECRSRGLRVSGKKLDLVNRIVDFERTQSLQHAGQDNEHESHQRHIDETHELLRDAREHAEKIDAELRLLEVAAEKAEQDAAGENTAQPATPLTEAQRATSSAETTLPPSHVEILKSQLSETKSYVDSLEAKYEQVNNQIAARETAEEQTNSGPNSSTQEDKSQSQNSVGYALVALGGALGLGWIFQRSEKRT
ncbi:Aim34p KNAG_0E00880 [Huiozyma naganishii CBS 8797]|uniref:SAP domain-containing protein n=1 Tax=Huiozyma naganishii (strain ATCC MYA-139 / BCRC 22969 / CBS 8797 / KCTC 17520 / NBRC 10181 / NCYC 3082 / Yp74L-3) TaxID=1071383 RepID=J7S7I3_HUIN7|nr:hypothetical protein KNAG_0E00880 [Kazachstania naganishii CBS 8797]CCK70356.1 hypothetical protein KNAG_0E00880 [Kazachstania naganishii CBS 8797]